MFKVWMLSLFLLEHLILVSGCSLMLVWLFWLYVYLASVLFSNTKEVLPKIFIGDVRLLLVMFSGISGVCEFKGVTSPEQQTFQKSLGVHL